MATNIKDDISMLGEMPHDDAAEEAVLGAVLLDPEVLPVVAEVLLPEHFWQSKHKEIYSAALQVWRDGCPPDQVTVTHHLAVHDQLDEVGGGSYLNWLVGSVATTVHARYYAVIVRKTARLRESILKMTKAVQMAYSARVDDIDAVEMEIAQHLMGGVDIGKSAWRKVGDAITLEEQRPGIAFPWPDLNGLLLGLKPGKVYIVAGRPSMGKSTVALNIARSLAQASKTVVFVTLEDTAEGVSDRLLRMELETDDEELQKRKIEPDKELVDASGVVANMNIWTPAQHVDGDNLSARLTAFCAQRPVDLVVVDYVQLLAESSKRQNRYDQVSDMSIQLARTAQRLGVPILVLSQLNRNPDDRLDHRPLLSDLRETGQLEQDAHAVLLLWRPGMYCPEGTEGWKEQYRYLLNVVVAKNKDGRTGQLKLHYYAATGIIRSWSDR